MPMQLHNIHILMLLPVRRRRPNYSTVPRTRWRAARAAVAANREVAAVLLAR
jgi:hypothetical protein